MKKTYYAVAEGHINGAFRKKGESCGEMTKEQAKYLLLSGLVRETPKAEPKAMPKMEPDPVNLDRKTR